MHSIENTGDIPREKILTSIPAGVQHTRSLTVSQFSRLVLSPGLKPSHGPRSRDPRAEGAATVYSEALVEANRKLLRGKIESRGVSPVCPVGRQARSPSSNDRALRPARKRRGRSGKGLNSEPPVEMKRADNHLGTLNYFSLSPPLPFAPCPLSLVLVPCPLPLAPCPSFLVPHPRSRFLLSTVYTVCCRLSTLWANRTISSRVLSIS